MRTGSSKGIVARNLVTGAGPYEGIIPGCHLRRLFTFKLQVCGIRAPNIPLKRCPGKHPLPPTIRLDSPSLLPG